MKFNIYSKISLITLISLSLISCTQTTSNTSNNVITNTTNKINTNSLLTNPVATKSQEKPSFLFVQNSQSGSLVKNTNSEDSYTLTLENVSASTTYFSDRPFRITGDMKTSDLTEHWNGKGKNSFANDPPNGALSITDENGDTKVVVIELTNPSYDKINKKLTYNTRILNDYENSNFKSLTSNVVFNDELPTTFNSSSLFIDNLTEKLQTSSNSKVNPIGNIVDKIKTKVETTITTKLKSANEKITNNISELALAQKNKNIGKILEISSYVSIGIASLIIVIGGIIGMAGVLVLIDPFSFVLGAILLAIGLVVALEGGVVIAIASALGIAGRIEEMKASKDKNVQAQALKLEKQINTLKQKQSIFNEKMSQLKLKQIELKQK